MLCCASKGLQALHVFVEKYGKSNLDVLFRAMCVMQTHALTTTPIIIEISTLLQVHAQVYNLFYFL